MPRIKKDAQPVCINMNRELLERLEEYCQKTDRSKTAAVERFVSKGLDSWKAGKEEDSD